MYLVGRGFYAYGNGAPCKQGIKDLSSQHVATMSNCSLKFIA